MKKIIQYIKNLWNKLRDPTRGLQKQHNKLLKEARDLQRSGDIPAFAKKIKEADDLEKQIQQLIKK